MHATMIFTLLFAATALLLLLLILTAIREQQRSLRRVTRQMRRTGGDFPALYKNREPSTLLLYNRLLSLTNGDTELVDRLLNQVAYNNPEKPRSWHYQKVIHDLERDRRTY